MEQVTPEMFSNQEQKIEELRQTVNKLIEFLIKHVKDAEFNLLNLRIDRDIR